MANKSLKYIENRIQLTNWYDNINNINESFTSELLKDSSLLLIRRKLDEKSDSNDLFAKKLKDAHPIFYKAMLSHLPGWQTIRKFTAGIHVPSEEFVDKMAKFCTAAFSFDKTVTPDDLLNRKLGSIPPLRTENERWNRYRGIYRCFYLYPDTSDAEEHQLRGGLLQLWEEAGTMHCRFITGVISDERFDEIKNLMSSHPGNDFSEEFSSYKKQLPDYEVLVCYEGTMDPSIDEYMLMKLQRKNHINAALIFLRRRDNSANKLYSGGLAAVTLCRQSKINCHAMAITRSQLSIEQDYDLLCRYLRLADKGELGIKITEELDGQWHRTTNSRLYQQREKTE